MLWSVPHAQEQLQGMRPTSPAAWEIMRNILRDRKVDPWLCCASEAGLQSIPTDTNSVLVDVQVKLLSQQELLFAQEKGVPVIDIRPPVEFETGHIVGCVSASFPYEGKRVMGHACCPPHACALLGSEASDVPTQEHQHPAVQAHHRVGLQKVHAAGGLRILWYLQCEWVKHGGALSFDAVVH